MDEKNVNLPIPSLLKRRIERALEEKARHGTGMSQKAYILHALVKQVTADEEALGLPPLREE